MHQRRAGFECEECNRIARALREAWRADNRAVRVKVQEVAASSGRDPRQLVVGWVSSLAAMPDTEMTTLLEAHYPEVARAKRQRDQHQAATGHIVPLHAGWTLTAYFGEER